jgi:hypothetical protein
MKPALQLFNQIMALGGARQVSVATSYSGADKYEISEERVIGDRTDESLRGRQEARCRRELALRESYQAQVRS